MTKLYLASLATVVLFAAASAAATQTAAPATRAVADARNALAAGNSAEAVRLADGALARQPGNRDATVVKISALVAMRDVARAQQAYDDFVVATKKEDAGLLRPIASFELRTVAASAGPDVYLQMAALDRLARSGDTDASQQLQRAAVQGMGTGTGVLADGVLARQGDAAAVRRLAEAASSPRIRDKSIVAQAAQSGEAKDAAYALVPLLREPNPAAQIAVCDALAALRYERAVPEIRALLGERGPVRVHAALALKRLGDSSGDEVIATLLHGPATDGQLAALEVSPSVSAEVRSAILKRALADPETENRIKAAELMARDNPNGAREILVGLLKSGDPFTRREAARALEGLGAPDVAVLHGMLRDSSPWLRMYAGGAVLNASQKPRTKQVPR